ncbi:hypothetical protein Q5Y75_24980 [Ruegeria sp. 2205SS24-7]|uniref:hypothetical protein n=1 Tax=Ruegeria discodermiae TaxID=3064389 RepID=UPI0027426E9E|nr:hypothetical protein [Ruegeria sp. 2205SS24-7]MDP5220444.1 hypothetical protein [Ruegeria sp. 2205SS24-7]
MSNSPSHLRDWIIALYGALEEAEPHRAQAIRKLAGDQISRMVLDDDRVSVRFHDEVLRVTRLRATAKLKSPNGATDRQTVTALLLGYMEVSEAISLGYIRLRGTTDEVMAICAIIEILVDASTRIPTLQKNADTFLAATDSEAPRSDRRNRMARVQATAQRERALLGREGLINSFD